MTRKSSYDQTPVVSRTKPLQPVQNRPEWTESHPRRRCACCLLLLVVPIFLVILLTLWVFLIQPGRSNILVLGIDSRDASNLGRSDTNILVTIIPSDPYIGMLSIPRDLWVIIPGVGSNRINAAHFFAEAQEPGSGPYAVKETVQTNFGVDIQYFVRLHHIGFLDLVDTLDGIDVILPHAMSGYKAGTHHLNGEEALALVRDRSGSDDFSRMERGQIVLKSIIYRMLSPSGWSKIPTAWSIISQNLDTDIPVWKLPSFILTIIRVGPDQIDARIITRDMVTAFISDGGANVLAPNWDLINPILMDIFGQ